MAPAVFGMVALALCVSTVHASNTSETAGTNGTQNKPQTSDPGKKTPPKQSWFVGTPFANVFRTAGGARCTGTSAGNYSSPPSQKGKGSPKKTGKRKKRTKDEIRRE